MGKDTGGTVLLEISGGVATIELNRPQSANALDLPTVQELAKAIRHAGEAVEVRALVIAGAGSIFSVGGDLLAMAAADDPGPFLLELAGTLHDAVLYLDELKKPVVAIVQGPVAGAALGLMLACDLIVAGRSARFLTAFSSMGLTPDTGTSWLLARAVGTPRALELMLTSRTLSAEEALGWGLVTSVVGDAECREVGTRLASQLAAGASIALGETRSLVRGASRTTLIDHLAIEARTIADAVARPEAQDRITRFVAQRRAKEEGNP